MQTVFNNDQCIHVFAQQIQEHGRTNNGNIFFEKTRFLYSYGKHFPLAIFFDENTIFVNDSSYSVTTSQHQSSLRSAILHIPKRIFTDNDTMLLIHDILRYNSKFENYHKKDLETKAQKDAQRCIDRATKRRKAYLAQEDLKKAKSYTQNAIDILQVFKRKPSANFRKFHESISFDNDAMLGEAKERLAKQKAREAKEAQKHIKQWLAGESYLIPYKYREHTKTLLRINGDNIDTSEGASFPIEDAIKAFKLIRKCKEDNSLLDSFMGLRDSVRLGYYRIDKIFPNGNVKAGCHLVPWSSIEHAAKQLKLI